jgi:peptide/nickel transport system substrate-binding protein
MANTAKMHRTIPHHAIYRAWRGGFAFFAMLLVAVFTNSAQNQPSHGGTVVISTVSELGSLNPREAMNSVTSSTGSLIFSGLITYNEQLDPVPDLAERWLISEDGMIWDFHLKQNVLFHDGSELTAMDVVYTYEMLQSGNFQTTREYADFLQRIEAVSPYIVRFTLTRPYASFIHAMDKEIVPAHILKQDEHAARDFGRNPVGTGPFHMIFVDEERMVLKAFEDYFTGRPYLDSVIIRFFPTRFAAWTELL